MFVISVSDSGEFGLIERIRARLRNADSVLLGPGDDAAVVASPDGRTVVTTDLLVEGVHFRRDWSRGYDIGRKAAAQNLADVVAMGASPTAIVVGLAAPSDLPLAWADELVDGLQDECARVGAGLAGGDVVRADAITIAVTALGDLGGRAPVTRSGARPGDAVVVVGRLGWSAAGLDLLRAGRSKPAALVAAHRVPSVPYTAGLLLARAGATSMIDLSDGLVGDLAHVARASGVRIELAVKDLPVPTEIAEAGRALGVDPLSWIAGGGEDHAFVATLAEADVVHAAAALSEAPDGEPLIRIGRVVAGDVGVRVVDGQLPDVKSHDHFA